jgi:class 3 adenylate cyclase
VPPASDSHRARNVALAAFVIGGLTSVLASAASAANGRPPDIFLPVGISSFIYVVAGAVVVARRANDLIGWMLVACGFAPAALVLLRHVFPVFLPVNIAFGAQVNLLPLAYIVLSFPAGRLIGRASRGVFWAAVLVTIVGGTAEVLTVEPRVSLPDALCIPCTSNPIRIFDPSLYPLWQDMNAIATVVLAVALIVIVVRRWRSSRGLTRTALTPVMLGGIAIALLFGFLQLLAVTTTYEVPFASQILLLTRMLVPVGLVAVLLRFYAARSAVTRDLVRMGRGTSITRLEEALRTSLRDPKLTIARWLPGAQAHVTDAGERLGLDPGGPDQSVLWIEEDGQPLAAVIHDSALESDAELLTVVGDAVRYAAGVSDLRDELTARGGDVSRLPKGEVTFLFGDVERSTELLARLGDAWGGVLETMRRHVRDGAAEHGGEVVDMRADECFLAFARPADALAAAIDLHRRLDSTRWPADEAVLLRIGLHTGHPELTANGYIGIDVHRAARVMAAGNGGQIVTSEGFAAAIEGAMPAGTGLAQMGAVQLRGFSEAESLFLVTTPA